ncbi:MAG TPA: hypothetical protein VJH92_05385 [Candidatus Nanoarchaeia archaeon]|nr:hypothetical protein [Candidatus Nanoarchaeia archaeon]
MFKDKRGLSTVVTTLIIILLVLVAIGIIWVVIRGVIEGGTQTADYAVKCLAVDVRTTALSCNTSSFCNVTLMRNAGGEPIAGVKMIFYNTTTSTSSTAVVDSPDDIAALTTVMRPISQTNLANTANKVDVTPYFTDSAGNDQICSQKHTFTV